MNVPEPFAVAWLVVAGIACIVILLQRRKIEQLEDYIMNTFMTPIEDREQQWLDDLAHAADALVYCIPCGFEHRPTVACEDALKMLVPSGLKGEA